MTMKITRALAIRDECRDNLNGLFSHSRAFCNSHAAMLEKRAAIYAKTAKCPAWVRSYLNGVWDTLTAELYRDALVYGAWLNGSFYSTYSKRADYYEKHGISAQVFAETSGATKGHYWINDLSKPFFIG